MLGWLATSKSVRAGLVSAAALGLIAAAMQSQPTHSQAAPVTGTAADRLVEARQQNVTRGNDRLAVTESLAQDRADLMRRTADQLNQTRTSDAMDARESALTRAAANITRQSTSLRDQSDFLMPTAGRFGSGFGMRLHPILGYYRMHNGQDIGGTCGQPIWAAQDGKVTKVATGGYNGGSGHNVRIDGGKISGVHIETAYLHMDTIAVRVGQKVHKGQQLGTVGNTGISTACHLHFSVYRDGKAVDPAPFLR